MTLEAICPTAAVDKTGRADEAVSVELARAHTVTLARHTPGGRFGY